MDDRMAPRNQDEVEAATRGRRGKRMEGLKGKGKTKGGTESTNIEEITPMTFYPTLEEFKDLKK